MIIKIFKGRNCFSHLAGEESEAQRGWAYAQASQTVSVGAEIWTQAVLLQRLCSETLCTAAYPSLSIWKQNCQMLNKKVV